MDAGNDTDMKVFRNTNFDCFFPMPLSYLSLFSSLLVSDVSEWVPHVSFAKIIVVLGERNLIR